MLLNRKAFVWTDDAIRHCPLARVFWSESGLPITIQQTMSATSMWQVSTGSTVWGS